MSSLPLPTPLPEQKTEQLTELELLRNRILRYILIGGSALGGAAYLMVLYTSVTNGQWLLAAIYSVIYLWLLIITFQKKPAFWVRAYSFAAIIYILGTSSLIGSGLKSSSGLMLLATFVLLMAIMINVRAGIVALVISLITLVINVIGTVNGWLPLPALDLVGNATPLFTWIINITIFIVMTMLVVSSLNVILGGLNLTLVTQKKLADDLSKERASLEQRVLERTTEIQKRAAQQQAAAQVAQAVSNQTNIDDILRISISQIQNRFGYYHAGIFLLDEKNEFAELRAATSDGGRQMIANKHKLRVGEEGIVGYVVAKGEPRIAVDVGLDATHFQNPYLPDTRSEMAIPLRTTSGVIGALDVQSREETAFTRDDVDMLQTIADQLASAIDHSTTINTLNQRVEELDASYRNLTKKSWQDFIQQTRHQLAYKMSRDDVRPNAIPVQETPQITQALQQGAIVMDQSTADDSTRVAVPIKLREQVLGVINFQFKSNTVPKDTIDMLETSAARLAVALENVRLLDDVQIRAEREHMVSDLSSKIRSSSEIDHILRTTAEELGKILGVTQVTVQLRQDEIQKGS